MTQDGLFRTQWRERPLVDKWKVVQRKKRYVEDYELSTSTNSDAANELNETYGTKEMAARLCEYSIGVVKKRVPHLAPYQHRENMFCIRSRTICIVEIVPIGRRLGVQFKSGQYVYALMGFACIVYTMPFILEALSDTDTDIIIDVGLPHDGERPMLLEKKPIQPRGVFDLIKYLENVNEIYEINRISEDYYGMSADLEP